jgi:DNA-binding NtrC family response regulator
VATASVLVVDDEVEFAQIIAERLRARGFDVDVAHDGAGGIEKVQARRYDAVVLDLAMPGMDGMVALKQMLEHDPGAQIIILTGQGSVAKGVEAVKLGAIDFLEKPADIETISGRVSEAATKRFEDFERGLEDKMSDIMKKKGW